MRGGYAEYKGYAIKVLIPDYYVNTTCLGVFKDGKEIYTTEEWPDNMDNFIEIMEAKEKEIKDMIDRGEIV